MFTLGFDAFALDLRGDESLILSAGRQPGLHG